MKNIIYYLLFFYAVICGLTIHFFNGTGDSGDSISHYLFARYAPIHPGLYFDHWAKPVFVLLASPFAQLGFTGMKLFNSLISLVTIFFSYKTAERLNIKNAILVAVFMMFSPLFYILTFSGLTEPLFALFTILGIYFCVNQKYLSACLVISFLPYVRSEGLIIIGVFVIYFFYKKLWKLFPFLFFGSLAYAIAGYFVHGDFLWVFTKIPYARLSSVYGSGDLFHFAEQLINVVGVPLYVLFWMGFAWLVAMIFKKKTDPEQHILILLGFSAFFMAHTLFWYLGIFNSMGLKRVLIGVMPLIALITLQGFNFISEELLVQNQTAKKTVLFMLMGYILIFPFTPNLSAIQWKKDMMLNEEQKLAIEITGFLNANENLQCTVLFDHPYLSITLNRDYFDLTACKKISKESISQMKPGDLLVWDDHYSGFEAGIKKNELDVLPGLIKLYSCKSKEGKREIIFSAYKKK